MTLSSTDRTNGRRMFLSADAIPVTVVIPVHNGEQWLEPVLDAILADGRGREMEIIAVEDGSGDRSPEILERYAAVDRRITVIDGPRRGAAAALNAGIRRARHAIVCQIDQDVILRPGWIATLAAALADPAVAAAQGYYETPRDGSPWARAMGLDLELRYRRALTSDVDHVCTGNTAYRVSALIEVGLFDETLGYGYDNDVSYRLVEAGYRLVICPDARSIHRWRDGWRSYLVQQYGFGYGRLDLVAKHRRRATGDDISRLSMMLHAPMMTAALVLAVVAITLAAIGQPWNTPAALAAAIIVILSAERLVAGIRAAIAFSDPAGLSFVPVHLARDLAWAAAVVVWTARRLRGTTSHPSHSMRPRPTAPRVVDRAR